MYDRVLGFKYWDNNFVSTCRLAYNGEAYEMDGWKVATATCRSDKGCKISDLKTDHPWIAQKNIRYGRRRLNITKSGFLVHLAASA